MNPLNDIIAICFLIAVFSAAYLVYHLASPYKITKQIGFRGTLAFIMLWASLIITFILVIIN